MLNEDRTMPELSPEEREEAFITLALSPKDAELYRRYSMIPHDELDKVGIPDLRRKMWEMTSRLVFAGQLDKECRVPFEKMSPDDYFSHRIVDGGPECGFKYGYVFSEFLVLRGGRMVCYDNVSWHEAVKYLLKYNDLEPLKMDDEPMIVRFTAGERWYEVHPRREIPSLLDAFKDHLRAYFKDVVALGCDEDPERCPFKFPMYQTVDFKIPCAGGLKVTLPTEDGKSEWLGFKALPLTCSDKGILAADGERHIRDVGPQSLTFR